MINQGIYYAKKHITLIQVLFKTTLNSFTVTAHPILKRSVCVKYELNKGLNKIIYAAMNFFFAWSDMTLTYKVHCIPLNYRSRHCE